MKIENNLYFLFSSTKIAIKYQNFTVFIRFYLQTLNLIIIYRK